MRTCCEHQTNRLRYWYGSWNKKDEMFYLITHSKQTNTRNEGNILFTIMWDNVGYLEKDHLINKRKNKHCSYFKGYPFRLSASELLYTPFHRPVARIRNS